MGGLNPPVLAFIDPGSRFCGWCVGDGTSLPRAGAWTFAQTGTNYGAVLAQLADALNAFIDTERPDELSYEEPILVFNQRYKDERGAWRKRNDNLATLRKTIPLGARIEEACYRRGIPCSETSCKSVKVELAGFATASKQEMVVCAEKLGVGLPEGPERKDAADALAGWLLLLRLRSRALSSRLDAALWGGRANALI